ncbi:putative epoxide hydrolase [Sclerotinia borealis F-4128]|uniref:Putative epoxide hydrolase n=1 Tax=Sclerotinia borealis (strain F-4128) TaxID=1432307 RepID=W9CRF0_SCLBF|nr:putative epoxide hydrolase [Sclerotinia borealis F-4128]
MPPQPFQISIPQERIDILKTKLSLAEFPDELPDVQWDMGVPLQDMKRLTKAWEAWDWNVVEEKLNRIPQFTTGVQVDGYGELDVHFVWQRRPGSFMEVLHLLPLLQQPGGPAFHIVAPSLPNYGFSEGVNKRGFALAQYAETCHKLMLQLGYDEYVTQGGDWGTYITRAIGKLYPQHCKASHINMIRGKPPTITQNPILTLQHASFPYSQTERDGFARTKWFAEEGRGYFIEQSTKPQTLAYALHDSPTALLAWIYEKLHDWTDSYPWTDDEIFTWVSIYYFSRAGPGAAHRIYYEVEHTVPGPGNVTRDDVETYIPGVKLGLSFNPKELSVLPKSWGRTLGEVVFECDNDEEGGGHFYAHERPELLARDLRSMFGRGGGAFAVCKGRDGYDGKDGKDGMARL